MKKTHFYVLVCVLFILFAKTTMAGNIESMQASNSTDIIESTITAIINGTVSTLQATAIRWLSLFILIQFVITNIGLLKSGADLQAVWAKLLGSLLWFAFCFYAVENGPSFVSSVGKGFFNLLASITGGETYDAGLLLNTGVEIGSNLIISVEHLAGMFDIGAIILAGICAVFVVAAMALIAFKVFLMKIEMAFVVMLSPISFSLLGLNALKDQGIAPFKSLISLLYRILILGAVIASLDKITTFAITSLNSIESTAKTFNQETGIGNGLWPTLIGLALSYCIIAYLAYKSDAMAASLASGSTNFGTADVAGAAAMGAALGAAVVTGGTSAATATAKPMESMSNFLKKLTSQTGGEEIKNASGSGTGGGQQPVGQAPTKPVSNGSTFPVSKNGIPIRPVEPASSSPETTNGNQSDNAISSDNQMNADIANTPTENTITNSASGNSKELPGQVEAARIASSSDAPSSLERNLGELVQAMSKSGEASFGERLKDIGHHVAQEKANTQVSINTHHTD